jgi:5-methyltetrahydrofolate--homocysteine methyltransferase
MATDWDNLTIPVPWFIGRRLVRPALEDLVPYIDWTPFFSALGLEGRFPAILNHAEHGRHVRELYGAVQQTLTAIVRDKRLTATGIYGFWPANTEGDDIVVYQDDARRVVLARFHMLRQQMAGTGPSRSLADFIAPRTSLAPDYIGAFAVTSAVGLDALVDEYEARQDEDHVIISRAIADRLTESFAAFLHAQARQDWGYARGEALSPDDLIEERHRGIRPVFGGPACPDTSEKASLFDLLGAPAAGIVLTDSFGTMPVTSSSGLYFSHPEAGYFDVGRIGRDQVEDYRSRKGISVDEVERRLSRNLGY